METVTPHRFATAVENALRINRLRPIFGWGKPGVGKTAVVRQVAKKLGLPYVDVRLGQLAPTDLRGMPVVDHETASTRWYRPVFLPTEGEGIFVLDEFNQAPPTMQGIAQQLLLARRLGEYEVPEGWLIVALGNRKEDRASVYDMPAQVENRFKHYLVEESIDDWRQWALARGLATEVVSFLQFRPQLLHQYDSNGRAWPSPRTWEYAAENFTAGESIVSCVGEAAAREFRAFVEVVATLPDLHEILSGRTPARPFPTETSAVFALVTGLAWRLRSGAQGVHAFTYLVKHAEDEWLQLYVHQAVETASRVGVLPAFASAAVKHRPMRAFLDSVALVMAS
jgi:MoxR-like ATPase